jgi:hypothetical protein
MWKHDGKDSGEIIEQGKKQYIEEDGVKRRLYSWKISHTSQKPVLDNFPDKFLS